MNTVIWRQAGSAMLSSGQGMRAGRALTTVAAHVQSSRRPGSNSSSTLHGCPQWGTQEHRLGHGHSIRQLQAPWLGAQHGPKPFVKAQQLVAVASRRSVSSSAGALDGSGSDSDSDATSCLGIDPSELGPNGELPWFYNDSKVKAAWRIEDELEVEHWQEVTARVEKPNAREALSYLDLQWRMGLAPHIVKRHKTVSGWMWFKRARSRNPMAVSLVRVGAFYEAVGIDAVLLVEYGGLNFMGSNLKVPRAGCPEANLLQLLEELVGKAGLSVAVWEELPLAAVEYGKRSKDQKQRFFSQLVTPENPVYLHGYADSSSDMDIKVPTLSGVSCSSSGLSVYRLNRAAAAVEVFHGLSDDGLWGLITADSSAAPVVYLHKPYSQLQQSSVSYASDADRAQAALHKRLKAAGVRVHRFAGADPLAAFLEHVARDLALTVDELSLRPARDMGNWPGLLPLYLSTLLQLGLLRNRGIPGLVDFLVPDESPKSVRELLGGLLCAPPPHEVAAATRQALRGMLALQEGLPAYEVGLVTPKKVAVVLQAGEAPEKFFQSLEATLLPVVASLDPQSCSPALSTVVKSAWPLLVHTMAADAQQLTPAAVLQACKDALGAICKVVQQPSAVSGVAGAEGPLAPEEEVLSEFAMRQERFRSRVVDAAIWQEVEEVDDAYNTLLAVIEDLLQSLIKAAVNSRPKARPPAGQGLLYLDDNNAAVWLKLSTSELRVLASKPLHVLSTDKGPRMQHLRTPYDRNGIVHKKQNLRTCDELDAALNNYRSAVANANAAATRVLKQLARELAGSTTLLAAAVQLSDLMTALLYHSRTVRASGWSVPYVGLQEQQQYLQEQQQQQQGQLGRGQLHQHQQPGNGQLQQQAATDTTTSTSSSSSRGRFCLKDLWPFWMVGADSSTIKNDVELDGFMLLTGPNMAGKSTVLRSVAAAALCGCVGLAIPAAPGSMLPQLDAVVLRTFSGDAPQEGLSAFGVEMKEMTYVTEEVRPHSLVLIDELGKGTEAIWGTALAAAILRQLVGSGASGIFATHLHLLLPLLHGVPRLLPYKMGVRPRKQQPQDTSGVTRWEATMRLEPGECTESLALEVAEDQGIPTAVLNQALQDFRALQEMGGQDGMGAARALVKAAGSSVRWNDVASGSSWSGSPASSGDGSTAAVSLQQGGEGEGLQQQQDDSGAAGAGEGGVVAAADLSRRKRRRNSSARASATEQQQDTAAAAAEEQQVRTLLAQLALGAPLVADAEQLQPQPWPDGQGPVAWDASSAVPLCGVVHHLSPGQQPPASHETGSWVYVLRYSGNVWYAGESQVLRKRREQHMTLRGQWLDMWYVLLGPHQDRRALQGFLTKALDAAGFDMGSRHDAHYARKK